MLLTIDVGNTNTVLGVFNKDKLEQSWRVKTDPRDTADELWLQYSALVDGFDITGVAITTTSPACGYKSASSSIIRLTKPST